MTDVEEDAVLPPGAFPTVTALEEQENLEKESPANHKPEILRRGQIVKKQKQGNSLVA